MNATEQDPLELVGVVVEDVGTPRNDGTPGSGLYVVPIRLNREATATEMRLLVETWDRPPSWSTMHRPGILRVHGDRVILDGTTIDEVRDVHATTLRTVIDRVNQLADEERSQAKAEASRLAAAKEAHETHVGEVAAEIAF